MDGRGPKVDRPDGKACVLVGLQMNPRWESQLGPGYRQAKVALVLVIETRSRLLDVAAGVLVEVEVMPHHVRRRHAPATDHEHDRQTYLASYRLDMHPGRCDGRLRHQ